MSLSFPDSGICLWGGPLACAGRLARLLDNSARSEERGWEPRADGASAPPKLSDIGLRARATVLRFYFWDIDPAACLPGFDAFFGELNAFSPFE